VNFLGPIGHTVAFFWLLSLLLRRVQRGDSEADSVNGTASSGLLDRLGRDFDYRWILAGALLPDLIDKPLAFLIDPDFVNNSLRNVGHSVVGGLALLALGRAVARSWRWASVGTFGVALAAHLVMDQMWRMPEVLFWPGLGFELPPGDVPFSHWARVHLRELPMSPAAFIGIGILIVFVGNMFRRRSVTRFMLTGRFS